MPAVLHWTLAGLVGLTLLGCETAPSIENARPAATVDDTENQDRLPDDVTLIERFAGDDRGLSIPYAKYRLDNGLTVVLHEDHSDPLVHVDVTYHVGSNREEPGRSGFAHFFEHMMFQGSEHVADEEHFRIVTNAGGTLNGTTNSDRTNYFQTVPINQLETVLWLESDRMGFLLDAVTQEKFEIQRATVKNERAQRVDNQPYGRALETLNQALYPEGHPYSWPVIGWTEDLDRADLNDLKRFFLRWYGPNNAVLSIGGAIDPIETLEQVVRYFGPIPAGPEVDDLPKQPAELANDRYVTLEDNIHLPALAMMMPTVHANHPDEPALDAAAKILGQGQASLLYQRLVQSGRAVQASVAHVCRELACEIWFIVIQNPRSGESLAEMETAVRETLEEFARRPVSADDLQKFKARYEAGRVFGLQSVAGKVGTLAAFETFTGSPAGIGEEIDRYLAVEADDVDRVFERYIEDQPAVVLSVVPDGQPGLAASEPTFVAGERDLPESYGDGGAALPMRRAEETFDRSQQPTPAINPQVELPPIEDDALANGVRVLTVRNDETPTVTVRAVLDLGQRDEPAGKAGLAALTAALMGEATQRRSAAEFSEALERIGASVQVSTGTYQTAVTLSTLDRHLDEAVDLMLERMLEPAFNEDDFARVKQQTIEGLKQARKTPGGLAARAIGAVLEGADSPLSFPRGGLPDTVEAITLDDVRAFHADHIPARLRGLLVSTSLPKEQTVEAIEALADLSPGPTERSPIPERPAINGRTLYLVDKPDAAQSSLRTGQIAIPYDALGDYYRAGLANFALGGTFNSRINLNLREDKGYTYGARTRFSGGPERGSFRFSSEVDREATAASIVEVISELERYADGGMTEEEFEFMRAAIGQRDALRYETPARKLGLVANILAYDLPLDYRSRQNDILQSVDRTTLNRVAARLIDPDNMAVVVVGDGAVIRPELETLDLPIVELDENGNVQSGDAGGAP
ncbi:MAG: insulinase family protein [Gammaproteobacteria bacterium]|jgi:zinc protease|nr:insulinase family protein [Gammaproteobacteria bacterium]